MYHQVGKSFPSGLVRVVGVTLVCSLVMGWCLSADGASGRGRHKQLYAVPAPENVKIDARLDEWDLSGQMELYVTRALRKSQSADLALMYDEEALYISGEVKDPTPMMNQHDPVGDAGKAWDADVCQFRMVLDPEADYPEQASVFDPDPSREDIVHLAMWYYTDGGSANLQMAVSMAMNSPHEDWEQGLVPYDKFDGAYRKWKDETGYTFEYRIPWDTLGAEEALSGGDAVAGTIQVNWGRKDGLSTLGGIGWGYDVMRIPGFPFQRCDTWGKIVCYPQNNVPRELVEKGVPAERPLPLEFTYELPADGETTIQLWKDDEAKRILVPQQNRMAGENTELWDGFDDYREVKQEHMRGEFLPPGEYQWKGIRSEEGVRAKYRFSVHNSGNPPYPTDDNTGGWLSDHASPATVAGLEDGMLISARVSEAGWGVIRTDTSGQKRWGASRNAVYMATDGEHIYIAGGRPYKESVVRVLTVEEGRPVSFAGKKEAVKPPEGGGDASNAVTGVACDENAVYVAYGARNLVAVFDTGNGKLENTWDVKAPGRMAMCPDGAVAVISGGKVVQLTEDGVSSWIDSHLDQPEGIAVSEDKTVYVANRGELQNVSVFDGDGNYLRHIGKEGGRPAMGRYERNGMREPAGIGLDANGRLWVAENIDSPKRVSVWNTETGKNVDEFFGASGYFTYGYIDPAQPDEIYAEGVLWKIDWENYTTEPVSTVWRQTEPNMAPAPGMWAVGGDFRVITADNGRQYGYSGAPHFRVVLYIRDGDIFRPFAGIINPKRSPGDFPALEAEGLHEGRKGTNVFWQDADGNGKVEVNEITRPGEIKFRNLHPLLPKLLRKDLSVLLGSGRILEPQKVTAQGVPKYDLKAAQKTPLVENDWFENVHISHMKYEDGAVYYSKMRGGKNRGQDAPHIVKQMVQSGSIEWYYTNPVGRKKALNLPPVKAGRLWATSGLMGVAGDYFAMQTRYGPNHIFRTDGTYVGTILKDPRAGDTSKDAYRGQSEGGGGSFIKLNIDGEDRYFVIHGSHDTRVWEVMGLDNLQKLEGGTYHHTQKKVVKARKAYEKYQKKIKGPGKIHIAPGRDALAEADPVERNVKAEDRGFKVRMAYDADNLYVRYDVKAPHGLKNGESDPRMMFRGGNCLDLQLATDSDADADRKEPAPGDLRLLVTRRDGEPMGMLYRPEVKGFDGDPHVFKSPTGKETFDRIREVQVGVTYEKTRTGFTATLEVPLDLLDLTLDSGEEIKLDVGYIFGNKAGTSAVRRVYAYNKSFTALVTDDVPHESRLQPHKWGTGIVK